MKVTIVVDNSVSPGARGPFLGEHGLAMLIEAGGRRFLFDTGQSGIVTHNLGLLGVHPSSLDAVILSHGHYDHTGGLKAVLQMAGRPMPVIAHEGIFQDRVSVAGNRRPIGIPYTRAFLTELGAQWRFSDRPLELVPGLWVSGQIPRRTGFERGDGNLCACQADGSCAEDAFPDDGALFHQGALGLQVIGGCTHSGVINTVQYGLEITGQSKLDAWVGGTHLGPAMPDQQRASLEALEQLGPRLIAANHCTGFAMMSALQHRFGSGFTPAFTGTVLEL